MLARIQKSMKEKDQGFTLIELLVVMIIIGILAAVAIPVFLNQKKKAADSAMKSDLVNVAQQIESESVDTNSYPAGVSGRWVNVTTLSSTLSSVKISPNDLVFYQAISDGYCIAAWNTKTGTSDADGGSGGNYKYYWYNSTAGGLGANVQPSFRGGNGCPNP